MTRIGALPLGRMPVFPLTMIALLPVLFNAPERISIKRAGCFSGMLPKATTIGFAPFAKKSAASSGSVSLLCRKKNPGSWTCPFQLETSSKRYLLTG